MLKKIKFIIPLVILMIFTSVMIACNSNNSDKTLFLKQKMSFEKLPWGENKGISRNSYTDVEIVSWYDGDTPTIKFLENFGSFKKNSTKKIRIAAIDTAELAIHNGPSTTGLERKWAIEARDFGKKEIPKGKKARLFSNKEKTYDRLVGSLFYGENYKNSYAVNIMTNGLAQPIIDSANILNKTSIVYWIGHAFADAYNYAVQNKIGMYKYSQSKISSELKTHGNGRITDVKWTSKNIGNIYGYIKNGAGWKNV